MGARVAPRRSLLLTLLLLVAPALAAGQGVVGELVERETDAPIAGAFVFLIDVDGVRVGGTMTAADGRFQLRPRRAGRYLLRAERIGYETLESDPLTLAPDSTVHFRFAIPTRPFVLEGISVEGDRRCVVRPGDGRRVARLWDEASKALRATAVTERAEAHIFVARYFREERDARRLELTSEESWERVIVGAVPYLSIDPDSMASTGFAGQEDGDNIFYGPDAELLLSDQFLDTHCLRLSAAGTAEPGLVGIDFEPVAGRTLPDIEGVIWLDEATGELRRVQYRYVGRLPFRAGRTHAGGRIEFARLDTGAWIVRRWWIRLPDVRRGRRSDTVRHYQVEGSEVVEVFDRDGRLLQSFERG